MKITFRNVLPCFFALFLTTFSLPSSEPDYAKALKLSLLFYEAQRSGHLPADNRISWRGDSALEDKGANGEDLTGGYYDASDFVKFGFTMAFSTTVLAWGVLLYEKTYRDMGEYQNAVDAVKWATDYFLKCHVSKNEFYGQVGDFYIDHKYWGRPEKMNMSRPAYKIDPEHPGSDLAAETSAALAAASLIFSNINATYSQLLLRHAAELYDFGLKYQGYFYKNMPGYKSYYENADIGDELAWAAIWLYKASNSSRYLKDATDFYETHSLSEMAETFWFDKKTPGVQLLLALETNNKTYRAAVVTFCDYAFKKQKRTPHGLIFIDPYGTLAYAANIAFICLKATDLNASTKAYYDLSKEQVDYMLGSRGRSYVIGYGSDYPTQPHHAASSCPDRPAPCGWEHYKSNVSNPQILYGALVSGPLQNDYYEDKRFEFLYNQVTIDYNSGFQGVLAGLIHFDKQPPKL